MNLLWKFCIVDRSIIDKSSTLISSFMKLMYFKSHTNVQFRELGQKKVGVGNKSVEKWYKVFYYVVACA